MVTKTPWHRDIGGGKSRSYTAPAAGSRPAAKTVVKPQAKGKKSGKANY